MRQDKNNEADVGGITSQQAKDIGIEYSHLLMTRPPSEQQEARIIEILELALVNPEVDRWVTHFTHERGKEMGLLSEEAQKGYDDQKALLKEHLGNPNLSTIRGKTQKPVEEGLAKQIKQHTVNAAVAAALNNEKLSDDE